MDLGKHASVFTGMLLVFALLLIPLFGTFLLGNGKNTEATSLRFAIGGCLSLTGVMGIGIWDLQHPLHYVGVFAWLLSTATLLDRSVPIGGRLFDLWIPVWPVQLCIVNYVGCMMLLPFSRTMHSACIVGQRMAVVAMMVWLFMLLRLRIWCAVKSLLRR